MPPARVRRGQCRRASAQGVPNDVGFQLVAMAPKLEFAVDHEMLAAQDMERLVCGADIGRRLLDDASQLFEAPRRSGADLAPLAVDRHAAVVVGGERDAPRSGGPGQAVAEGYGRRIEGQGIERAKSRHRVEKQRQIGHIARHWPLHRELAPQIADGAARHAPRRRTQPDDRAMAARAAQRAAMVTPLREPDLAGRHRHRAAAGRAARGQRGVPGIARPAEHLIEGAAAAPNSGVFDLPITMPLDALDALDQRVRLRRHVVGEERRAVGRAHARDIGEVLDRDRQAGKPAGSPSASQAAPPRMMRWAWSRARSRQRVGSAFTTGSTSPMRRAEASTSSRGEISRFLSRATASTADIRQSSSAIECLPYFCAPRQSKSTAPRRTTARISACLNRPKIVSWRAWGMFAVKGQV